ncbi:MAG TPA: energy transducer TonB, partial [Vicinamibacterales bacterium]|nr:energy transducer TonB [Vicinamibacterales bacterium]
SDLLSLLTEKELAGQAAFSDMKMVAEGFLKLADQQLAVAVQRAGAIASTSQPASINQPPSVNQPASMPASPPAPADPPRIYTIADQDVVPPVAIEQTMPPWTPPLSSIRYQEFSGLLEVIVDEAGAVTSVAMVQHVNVLYDQLLTSAAKRWRYRPAMRNGKPVMYRKQMNIVLRPVSPTSGD